MKMKWLVLITLIIPSPLFAERFNYKPLLDPNTKNTLYLFTPEVNPATGQVSINGVDTSPANSFTWDWGDGIIENLWFPGGHTYQDTSKNYIVVVTSNYIDGTREKAKVIVIFTQSQLLPIQLPDNVTVRIPEIPVDMTSRMPGYGVPSLVPLDESCFDNTPRGILAYVLTVGAVLQMDYVDGDIILPDNTFQQVILRDPAIPVGMMYSLWYTTPVAFATFCESMQGGIAYSSFFHEMGHNVTLNFPAGYHYGGKIDGLANTIYSETMAQIFQHATLYDIINRYDQYGLTEEIAMILETEALNSFRVICTAYQRYLDEAMPFHSWDVPDSTFDTFMTIAYKFMEHAENQNLGYRTPVRRLSEFLAHFNPDWHSGFSQHADSPEAEAFRATLMTAALSYAFGSDLREEFAALNFPLDDSVFDQLLQTVTVVPCGGTGKVRGDLNNDCLVDLQDLAVLVKNWLKDNRY